MKRTSTLRTVAIICLALYLGIYECFIGGIVQIINEIKNPEPVRGWIILLGIIRIFATYLVFWVTLSSGWFVSITLGRNNSKKHVQEVHDVGAEKANAAEDAVEQPE